MSQQRFDTHSKWKYMDQYYVLTTSLMQFCDDPGVDSIYLDVVISQPQQWGPSIAFFVLCEHV